MSRQSDMSRRLEALRDVLGQEAVEDALRFYPTNEVEELARHDEDARASAEATATHLTMRETRDAIQAGRYGKEAAAKLATEVAERGSSNDPAVLRFAAKLAAEVRKQEYFRRLNGSKQNEM